MDCNLGSLVGSGVWDPGDLADGAGETSPDITVTGAATFDAVIVYPPVPLQGLLMSAWVKSSNTVAIRLQNETGGNVNLASGTWFVRCRKG